MPERLSLPAVAFLVLAFATSANAAIRPSFHLEECAWNATNIIVASQLDATGRVTVLESWKGELAKEATLKIVDLPAAPLNIWRVGGSGAERQDRQRTPHRAVSETGKGRSAERRRAQG